MDTDTVVEYIPKDDLELPAAEQTVFLLRPLKSKELARLEDNMAESTPRKKGGTLRIKTGTHVVDTLSLGLAGVRNFGGKDIILADCANDRDRRLCLEGLIDAIPPRIRRELADEITGDVEVSKGEEKN
jgi:hypothetical protein